MCDLLFICVEVGKTIRKRAQIWDRGSLEKFAKCLADFTFVGGPTMQEV